MGFVQNELLRYSRQIILREIGYEGQDVLKKSRVLVVGAGGLGSPALLYLAASGIGTIGIVDFDTVTLSNLNRQIIHSEKRIGSKKILSAKQALLDLNSDTIVKTYDCRINENNVEDIVSEYDVVIDAADNFAARYLISDACFLKGVPAVEAGAVGFEGIVMTIIPEKTSCYRCLYPNIPKDGSVPNCSNTGIIGAAAGVIGSIQALEAIKLVLNKGANITNSVLIFNGLNMEFKKVKVPKRDNCALCGKKRTILHPEEYHIKCINSCIDHNSL